MKKKWIKFIVILIIVLVLIPLGVAYFLRFEVTGVDKSNEWIGFWGGYLGAINGGVITLWVMHLSLKDGRRNLNQQMDFEKRKSVLESIEKYYITNGGKEETIDNEEAICERIRILKKDKMRKEFDNTVMTGFLLPLIYLIYFLLPKDSQHKPIIVIIVSVIIAIIYLLIACGKHKRCIQCELKIDELERQYSEEESVLSVQEKLARQLFGCFVCILLSR